MKTDKDKLKEEIRVCWRCCLGMKMTKKHKELHKLITQPMVV